MPHAAMSRVYSLCTSTKTWDVKKQHCTNLYRRLYLYQEENASILIPLEWRCYWLVRIHLLITPLFIFLILQNYMSVFPKYIHIWQVSPQAQLRLHLPNVKVIFINSVLCKVGSKEFIVDSTRRRQSYNECSEILRLLCFSNTNKLAEDMTYFQDMVVFQVTFRVH